MSFTIVEPESLARTEYETGVDEFKKSGLTPLKSNHVKPPRVKESPISFECEVDQIIELGKDGGAGNLVISRIVHIHVNNKYLDENGALDTKKLDLVGRMGASWYTRVIDESLFEIPKPIHTKGIGVDQLPDHVHSTEILSKNNLARLGNLEKTPSQEEIQDYHKSDNNISQIMNISDKKQQIKEIHSLAKNQINSANLDLALEFVKLTNSPWASSAFAGYGQIPANLAAVDMGALAASPNLLFNDGIKMLATEGRNTNIYYSQAEPMKHLYDGIMEMFLGVTTVDEVIEKMNKETGYSG